MKKLLIFAVILITLTGCETSKIKITETDQANTNKVIMQSSNFSN